MRFAGTVVADDQKSLIILGMVILELRKDNFRNLLGHPFRDHIGFYQLTGPAFGVSFPQLHYSFDRFKMDQVSVLHSISPPFPEISLPQRINKGIDFIILSVLRVIRLGINQRTTLEFAVPCGNDSSIAADLLK